MSWRIFLWSLLLVVPRIVKGLEYCLVPYIIAENPEMNYKEALKLSRNMMYGNKKHMFFYFLSYAFYFLLSFVLRQIEEGFGALSEIIYTIPYIQVSTTELYIAVRDRYCAANPECGLRDTNKNTNKDPDFWKNNVTDPNRIQELKKEENQGFDPKEYHVFKSDNRNGKKR